VTATAGESAVRVALVYPELLGTYGDRGNAVVLAQRLRWRRRPVELSTVGLGEEVPTSCDVYLLGGGEDGPESLAAGELGRSGALSSAVDRGAVVFAVCAGLQILGTEFVGPDGGRRPGLGLLDCTTTAGRRRAIGELAVRPDPAPGLPTLTGYENHGARTHPGPRASRLGAVLTGTGNGDGSEGVVTGRVVGTYLHGPSLARNPALADMLLGWVTGPLPALDDAEVDALRAERLAATVGRGGPVRRITSWAKSRFGLGIGPLSGPIPRQERPHGPARQP